MNEKTSNSAKDVYINDSSLIEFEGLTAWYKDKPDVLKNVNLHMSSNELVGRIGLNGAGKTTLINTISGIHKGYSVTYSRFLGADCSFTDNKFKRQRFTVFTEDDSFQYNTFEELQSFVVHAYGVERDTDETAKLVDALSFDQYRQTPLKNLSTGNSKKAFLIIGLSLKLPLLILDEPFNGLDFQSTENLYDLFADYRKYGSILYTSHIFESISRVADRIVVLKSGELLQGFSRDEVCSADFREALKHGRFL